MFLPSSRETNARQSRCPPHGRRKVHKKSCQDKSARSESARVHPLPAHQLLRQATQLRPSPPEAGQGGFPLQGPLRFERSSSCKKPRGTIERGSQEPARNG